MSRPTVSIWQRLRHNQRVVAGGIITALLVITAIFAPWIAPMDPLEQDLLDTLAPPQLRLLAPGEAGGGSAEAGSAEAGSSEAGSSEAGSSVAAGSSSDVPSGAAAGSSSDVPAAGAGSSSDVPAAAAGSSSSAAPAAAAGDAAAAATPAGSSVAAGSSAAPEASAATSPADATAASASSAASTSSPEPEAQAEPEGPRHWLGTDSLGRDVLSRLIWGARTALIVAVSAALLAALVGTVIGAAAGYLGGRTDAIVSRLIDVWMAFPPVLLAVVLVAVLGTGLTSVVVAIVVVDWTRFARVVRAETRAQAALDYVTSARMLGLPGWRIVVSEIAPNLLPLLITLFTMEMGIAIVVETILSFVGLSVASGASTWGGMLGEGRLYVNQAPWLMMLPMLATMLCVIGLNALGDGLRRELDPVVRT